MTLSQGQLDALCNLSRKKAGFAVGWVAIAAARELTELGLAARDRGGWRITAGGEEALKQQGPAAPARESAQTLPFRQALHPVTS